MDSFNNSVHIRLLSTREDMSQGPRPPDFFLELPIRKTFQYQSNMNPSVVAAEKCWLSTIYFIVTARAAFQCPTRGRGRKTTTNFVFPNLREKAEMLWALYYGRYGRKFAVTGTSRSEPNLIFLINNPHPMSLDFDRPYGTMMLHGPPGTGKTQLVGWAVREANQLLKESGKMRKDMPNPRHQEEKEDSLETSTLKWTTVLVKPSDIARKVRQDCDGVSK